MHNAGDTGHPRADTSTDQTMQAEAAGQKLGGAPPGLTPGKVPTSPKATSSHTTPRRRFLRLIGAAPALALPSFLGVQAVPAVAQGAAVAAPPSGGDDAELIGWCAAVIEMEAEWQAELELDGDAMRPAEYFATVQAIEDTSARTDEGNRAKLAAAISFFHPDWPEEGALLGVVLRDAVYALALPPSVPAVVASDPDAVLLALCAEIEELDREANRLSPGSMDEDARLAAIDRNCDRWEELLPLAAAIPAHTLAGVRARARALGAVYIRDLPDLASTTQPGEAAMLRALARDLVGEEA